MTPRQKFFSFIIGFVIFSYILNLIRKRRLREEYSWLWFFMAIVIMVLISWYSLLEKIAYLIGAKIVTTALFLFALLFLTALSIQFSIEISELSEKVKKLSQELSIRGVKLSPKKTSGRKKHKIK